jgi:hypothetical protein
LADWPWLDDESRFESACESTRTASAQATCRRLLRPGRREVSLCLPKFPSSHRHAFLTLDQFTSATRSSRIIIITTPSQPPGPHYSSSSTVLPELHDSLDAPQKKLGIAHRRKNGASGTAAIAPARSQLSQQQEQQEPRDSRLSQKPNQASAQILGPLRSKLKGEPQRRHERTAAQYVDLCPVYIYLIVANPAQSPKPSPSPLSHLSDPSTIPTQPAILLVCCHLTLL